MRPVFALLAAACALAPLPAAAQTERTKINRILDEGMNRSEVMETAAHFTDRIGRRQFIQDPLDYGSRLHHTSLDSYDHMKPEDLRQAAVIMATFLLNAANCDESLPRMPIPQAPQPNDPFEYPQED